jgi:pyruvate dehydrogenase E2 component (dihydrolipoamide acetyltransferase)
MSTEGIDRAAEKARKAVARTVTESWKIPQFWAKKSARTDEVKAWLATGGSPSASLSDVVVWATAKALRVHPRVLAPDGQAGPEIAITYLVAGESGLLAPSLVVPADTGIGELAAARRELVARALGGRMTAADARPGSFAVSNLGPAGIDSFSALVLPGQRAILAVGSPRPELRLEDGVAVEITLMDLVLSVDHREIDGAESAAFLGVLATTIAELAGDGRS